VPSLGRTASAGLLLNFEVEGVNEEYARLTAAGVVILLELRDEQWGHHRRRARRRDGRRREADPSHGGICRWLRWQHPDRAMTLERQTNLGSTIVRKLSEVGVEDHSTLKRLGPPEVYRRLAGASNHRLPLCHYLCSLAGALRDGDWRSLDDDEKARLRLAAGLR